LTDHAPYQRDAFAPPPAYAGPPRPIRIQAGIAVVTLGATGLAALLSAGLWAYVYLRATGAGLDSFANAALEYLEGPNVRLATTLLIVTGIAFVVWLHRARVNLDGPDGWELRWKRGWTIGGWFVPLANFVIPLLVVNEIDAVSERRANEAAGRPPVRRAWIMALWAVLWTVFWLLDRFAGTLTASGLKPADTILVLIAGAVLEAAAAGAAIVLVLRITANQQRMMAPAAFPPPYSVPVYPAAAAPGAYPPVPGAVPPVAGAVPPSAGAVPSFAEPVPPVAGLVPPVAGLVPPVAGPVPPVAGLVPPVAGLVPPVAGPVPPGAGATPPVDEAGPPAVK
jgi:hypothetical protein